MTVTREAAYSALFALGQGLSWGAPPVTFPTNGDRCWAFSMRRVKTPDQLGAGMMPALCQAEFRNTTTQARGIDQLRVWSAAWFIYHFEGDDDAIPATTTNAILDAIDGLFTNLHIPQTLGGLVDKVWIEGDTEVYGGNIDAQTLIVVPIRIQVP